MNCTLGPLGSHNPVLRAPCPTLVWAYDPEYCLKLIYVRVSAYISSPVFFERHDAGRTSGQDLVAKTASCINSGTWTS